MDNFKVYMHINKVNGKKYIGITSQPVDKRFREGEGYRKNIHFYRAIKKYGWSGFEHIIVSDGLCKEAAEKLEIKMISENNTTDLRYGYNITRGGDGLNGYVPTEEDRRRKSIMFSGKKNPFYGKKHSAETLEKLAQFGRQRCSGDGNPFYGKKHSEESKEKMRVYRTGKHLSEDTKAKISDALRGENNPFKGKTHSDEQKKVWSKKRTGKGNPRAKAVDRLTLGGEYIDTFDTAKEAGECIGVCNTGITRCCKGEINSSGGYKWRYSE